MVLGVLLSLVEVLVMTAVVCIVIVIIAGV